jgi:pimeloyl-ACP methyl ester carboxylesterase
MDRLRARLRQAFEADDHPLRLVSEHSEAEGPVAVTRLAFASFAGEAVRGICCRPMDGAEPCAGVLVIHAHGNRYDIGADELLAGRPALHAPIGRALAEMGIASLCLDLPCFGHRAAVTESAAAKAALWRGRSLAGQMVGECHAALDWLAAQPWVRADRIGVFGISMGATLGYWLAAVDPRVRALVQECCLADFAALIATGAHDLHGIYLTIPGLLNIASNGRIAGLIAPRAQFIGIGDSDPLTPPDAVEISLAEVRAAYAAIGGRLEVHREPLTGHAETPAMRRAALAFLSAELS